MFGIIDILINNIGGFKVGNFFLLIDDDWKCVFELNFFSYICIICEVVFVMKKSGGCIVNIVFFFIKELIVGFILLNIFCIGIVGFIKIFVLELVEDGILINMVVLGRIVID